MGRISHWPAGWVAGLILSAAFAPARAVTLTEARHSSYLQQRGADVGKALLVEYYEELPQPGGSDEKPDTWSKRMKAGLDKFKERVNGRYSEGTLQRILNSSDAQARRAAVLALGLLGTMRCNEAVALMLHDDDRVVRQLAVDALWALWFRGDQDAHVQELKRILALGDAKAVLAGLNALIKKAPRFAEAVNQRAVLHFRMEEYQKSVTDCEKTLKLNPYHFGAQAGMAQCYIKLRKPRAALKAFRAALKINPELDGVEDTIRDLEDVLGEEGRKDDKK